jgi:uncharacterized membrane protein YbhN (UPF0104 family)
VVRGQPLGAVSALASRRRPSASVRRTLTAVATAAAVAVLAVVLAGKSDSFTTALHSAPWWLLAGAAALQLLALLTRTEAWHVSVRATGATVGRRCLYRASSVGSVAVVINSQLGVAARIATLRRSSPEGSPRVPALLGAELPIVATEAILAALTSFTLVGPLGLPWWVPLVCVATMVAAGAGLCALARAKRRGLFAGLAVLRNLDGRGRLVALVLVAVLAQIARNWLVLRSVGVGVSLFDSIAVLIAMVTISQLPLGPSVGAAATVLILGTHGVSTVAAAGVLLTATGTAGALCFAAWGAADWLGGGRLAAKATTAAGRGRAMRRDHATTLAIRARLGALPPGDRRIIELAYFGGLDQAALARALYAPLAVARSRPWLRVAPAWS